MLHDDQRDQNEEENQLSNLRFQPLVVEKVVRKVF